MEKAYRTMQTAGVGSVVIGIVVIVTGIAAGVISIVNGVRLLKDKKEIIF